MDNDKVFTGFALGLIALVASAITASVMAGFATLPSLVVFLEHLAMSLLFRAAYKSFGGFDWADWSVAGAASGEATAASEPMFEPGIAGNAPYLGMGI